jgi:hypothetical protein
MAVPSRRPIWRFRSRAVLADATAEVRLPPTGIPGGTKGAFHCFLAGQPGYLVPARLLVDEVRDDDALSLNPDAWCSWWDGEMPARVAACQPLPNEFLDGTDLLWIGDPIAETVAPFWLDPAAREEISALWAGLATPLDLTPRRRAVLASAGVLVRANRTNHRRRDNALSSSRAFRERGYCAIRGLIHPFHLASLRRYYRRLLRTGGMTLGDCGSPRRFVAHNDGVARFFHRQLASTIAAVAGVPVKPSYVYVTSYQSGAELPPHSDRAQCEYSITLLVDFTPEPDDLSPWPLHLSAADGRVTVWLGIGDGLLYRGRQLSHHRDRLLDGMTSTSILFHYVAQDFAGPLD